MLEILRENTTGEKKGQAVRLTKLRRIDPEGDWSKLNKKKEGRPQVD